MSARVKHSSFENQNPPDTDCGITYSLSIGFARFARALVRRREPAKDSAAFLAQLLFRELGFCQEFCLVFRSDGPGFL